MPVRINLPSIAATAGLGRSLGRLVLPGDVLTLAGNLGAGKTTLTRFLGEGLGVPASCAITSPTYSIIHEYPGRIPLYHVDLYRLAGEDDVLEVGLEDYLCGGGVCVIEWPDRLGALLPLVRLEVELQLVSETERVARLTGYGGGWEERVRELAGGVGFGVGTDADVDTDTDTEKDKRHCTSQGGPESLLITTQVQPTFKT